MPAGFVVSPPPEPIGSSPAAPIGAPVSELEELLQAAAAYVAKPAARKRKDRVALEIMTLLLRRSSSWSRTRATFFKRALKINMECRFSTVRRPGDMALASGRVAGQFLEKLRSRSVATRIGATPNMGAISSW